MGKVTDKTSIPDMFIVNGEQITDHKLISEGFTTYFSTIGKSMALRIPNGQREYEDYLRQGLGTGNFYISLTDPAEVLTIINSLKPKRSCGSDRISTHLLKQIGPEISDIISKAINKSISSARVPFCLKAAKIIPIYKAGDDKNYSNYRPISILPSISKVLEKVMHKRLYNYMQSNNYLYKSQYGFRKKHSTNQAVLEFVSKVTQSFVMPNMS